MTVRSSAGRGAWPAVRIVPQLFPTFFFFSFQRPWRRCLPGFMTASRPAWLMLTHVPMPSFHCVAAKEMVQQVLDKYDALLNKLTPEERGKLERSMGLKIAQLKASGAVGCLCFRVAGVGQ